MKARLKILLFAVPILADAPLCLHAQLVADGDTLDLTTATNLLPGNLTVGTNGSNTSLTITGPDGAVANALGRIGLNASSSNNSVTVTGVGALWTNAGSLYAGNKGGYNQLTVNDGGAVKVAGEIRIGNANAASYNRATVSDPGSVLRSAKGFEVGYDTSFNALKITNGGTVITGEAFIGYGYHRAANNNSVTVDGKGSLWNSGPLSLGEYNGSSGNQLIVRHGAEVHAIYANVFIGEHSTSSNNTVLVTGGKINSSILNADSWIYVGDYGHFNQLVISNNADVGCGSVIVGNEGPSFMTPTSGNNRALLTGPQAALTSTDDLVVGLGGIENELVVSSGAVVNGTTMYLGLESTSSNNTALVSNNGNLNFEFPGGMDLFDAQINQTIILGYYGSGNRLIFAGGYAQSNSGYLGYKSSSSNNAALLLGGPGVFSTWGIDSNLAVGYSGSVNQLVVSNTAGVNCGELYIGANAGSTNNLVAALDGGAITAIGNLDVRRGTLQLDGGTVSAGTLLATNATLDGGGFITFNGGTLSVTTSTVDNSSPLVVGNGSSSATYRLLGNGQHTFNDGLTVSANAALKGNGTISGMVTVAGGGRLLPGNSIGRIVLSNSPALLGNLALEISKDGATLTNDQIQVIAPLTYGGTLKVSNLGPTGLVAGDTFPLFNAESYSGAFSGLTLPPLNSGLMWTNRLLFDGSIAVVPQSPPAISGVTRSGTNLQFSVTGGSPGGAYDVLTSTNLARPSIDWTTELSGHFDWLGKTAITSGISVNETQRYFRLSIQGD